jgi:fumarylacetoacetase
MTGAGPAIDDTHDPALSSWVASARAAHGDAEPGFASDADFPIQNLPFGVVAPAHGAPRDEDWRIGVAIGGAVLDLRAAVAGGAFSGPDWEALTGSSLNAFMARGPGSWQRVRRDLSQGLRAGSRLQGVLEACLLDRGGVQHRVPATIGDYTDFFTSIHHATRVGRLLRPDNPLLPNYRWVPIAYHGRSSSIVISGTPVRRPHGQVRPEGSAGPLLAPTRRLDYELELAAYIGAGNAQGVPIAIGAAEEQLFGLCLLNDWSARDIQAWEYQPLGPFLAKSFATSISPWIVTSQALAPFRVPWTRPAQDPQPLPYLDGAPLRARGAIDIRLCVALRTAAMRARGEAPFVVSRSEYREAYWTLAQLVTHHTVAGCNLRAGDLLATGTQSGALPEQGGSLLELTEGGKQPLRLPTGEQRRFLEDGDEVILSAHCEGPGAARIGFGICTGTVLAASGA